MSIMINKEIPTIENHYFEEIDKLSSKDQKRYFLDVGANLGLVSFYALSKGWNVVMFESSKENLNLIKLSINLNPLYKDKVNLYSSDKFTNLDYYSLPLFDLIKIDYPQIIYNTKDFFKIHNSVSILIRFNPSKNKDVLTFFSSLKYDKIIMYDKRQRLYSLNNFPSINTSLSFKFFRNEIIDLFDYEYCIYSSDNQDGIIEVLINLLSPMSKYYVEFYVNNELSCNTRILRDIYSWNGILFGYSHKNHFYNLYKEQVTIENINFLFHKYNITHFDLLSINMNYNDVYIWKAITHQPKIVIINYNPIHSPFQDKTVVYDPHAYWDGSEYFGASILSIYKLGRSKGYSLVYSENESHSLFFVLDELIPLINSRYINMPHILYEPPEYNIYRKDNHKRKYIPLNIY